MPNAMLAKVRAPRPSSDVLIVAHVRLHQKEGSAASSPPPCGEGWVGARLLRWQMTPKKESLRPQTRPAPHHARGWMSGGHPQPCPPDRAASCIPPQGGRL